jgi:hypothetical protein
MNGEPSQAKELEARAQLDREWTSQRVDVAIH